MGGKGTKKVPLPVDFHLKQAVGALTLHTGRNYMYRPGHKKCQRQSWRTHVACFKWKSLQRWGFFSRKAIESTKKASDFVRCFLGINLVLSNNLKDLTEFVSIASDQL